jgi:Trk K+ transport system NAD-binding subunit
MGHVGWRVAKLLRRLGEDVTIVTLEARGDWRALAERAGIGVVIGDARDESLLAGIGLPAARAVVATTDQDAVNVEIALDARAARADLPIVIRLFDQTLGRELEGSLGLRGAFAVSSLAAPSFAAAALGGRVLASFPWHGDRWVVARASAAEAKQRGLVTLSDGPEPTVLARAADWHRAAGSPPTPAKPRSVLGLGLVADAWREARRPLRLLASTLLVVIAFSAVVFWLGLRLSPVDAVYFLTATVTTTGYGDINLSNAPAALKLYGCLVMVLGSVALATFTSMLTEFLVASRLEEIVGRRRAPREGHVVVAGLGNLGYRVVEELRAGGVPVVGVDSAEGSPWARALRGSHTAVVTGDARLPEVLERACAARAAAVLATSGDDAANLGIALAARRLAGGVRTVVRLFDADFAEKAKGGLKLDEALSASRLAAPMFAAAALVPGVRAAVAGADALLVVAERPAGDLAGLAPAEAAARGTRIAARGKGAGDATAIAADEALLVVLERPLATV